MVQIQLELSDKANAIVTFVKTKNKFKTKEEAVNFIVENSGMVE